MSLEPGSVLDHYTIVEMLGQGGMGEVYRAQDTRLPRDVAVKVSHEAFSERFAREARVIAALNHPNICTLYDVGPNYLVMELVEGETLEDRLKQGALSEVEAIRLGRQIADALDYAHEKGVVHRDLKPANVKIRPDGVVKVLDFGLARIGGTESKDQTVTRTMGMTQIGAILGTPAYMAPEQAAGRNADKRADVWAFGIVMYESLSGGRPFSGETLQEAIAATLRDAPDLSKVSPKFRKLLSRCLEKDPQNRPRHIGDAMLLLDDAPAPSAVEASAASRSAWMWPALATVSLLAAAGFAWLYFGRGPERQEIVRLQFTPQNGVSPAPSGAFALSPDGKKIVFAGSEGDDIRYWVRSLDSLETRPLNESKGTNQSPPFFSPDSRYIAFVRRNSLYKMDLNGGAAQEICRCAPLGAAWFKDGSGDAILLGLGPAGIQRISANGGTATPVTTPDRAKNVQHYYPLLVGDGKHYFYLAITGQSAGSIRLGTLGAKPDDPGKTLDLETQSMVGWIPSTSRLLYVRDFALYARPFDPNTATFTGDAVQILPRVGLTAGIGFGHFAVSDNGVFVYRTGAETPSQRLKWFDRAGKELGAIGEPAAMNSLALSPDGNHAAVMIPDARAASASNDLWIADLVAGTRTRLTSTPRAELQVAWSPDGKSVAYNTVSGQEYTIYHAPSNGVGAEELFFKFETGFGVNLTHWSPDGKRLLFQGGARGQNAIDLYTLPLAGERKLEILIRSGVSKVGARFSPDGRYIAYRANESGRNEVYAQSVPGSRAPEGKWVISRSGAAGMIRWRKDGRELYYLAPDGAIMAVDVSTTGAFQSSAPHKLFDVPAGYRPALQTSIPGGLADVTSDGQRFLFALPEEVKGEPFTVVLNWRPEGAQ